MIFITLLISASIISIPLLIIYKCGLLVILSFYLVAPLLILILWKVIFSPKAGLGFSTTFLFFLLFFYVAPIFQLDKNPQTLLNTLPVRDEQIIYVNVLTAIFLIFYRVFYFRRHKSTYMPSVVVSENKLLPAIPLLIIGSIIVSAWGFLGLDIVNITTSDTDEAQYKMATLIKHKVIFLVPFLAASVYLVKNSGNTRIVIIFLLMTMVIMTKNPFYDRRNSLGPVYLTLISLAFPYIQKTRRFFIFLFIALGILFPASSVLTHNPPSDWMDVISLELIQEEILGHFTNMHYDAWANFAGAVDFVDKQGFQLGGQITGSLLFFVPRALWPEKPISSGQMLGEYLSQNYELWFENISFPLPAEGYIDFGVIGVIIFAIILSLYTSKLDRHVSDTNTINKISAVYFSLYLLFVLRGSLAPAFSYGVGAYLAINVLPFLLSHLYPRYFTGIRKTKAL